MSRTCKLGVLAALALAAVPASASCPFLGGQKGSQPDLGTGVDRALRSYDDSYYSGSGADFSRETYEALQADITAVFTDSQDFWPADFGNYAPLMIRLAWHCNGNYRQSDGRGGCDGGRIRFNPERSWADNTNLDKALTLLQPIKLKYGDAVSWGDLITLTGNEAIRSMGGPVLGFCAGRLDDASGFDSLELGPSPEQEAVAPCAVNGTCEFPLGTSTVGLIYVNPEGPLGVPDPAGSAADIRDVFGRMGMNDSETVALIGGGHAFGKFHGACATGPGPDPTDAPEAPWPGTCGDPDSPTFGRAENTFTSGFEGQWTVEPLVWDNAYFKDLLEYDWVMTESPADQVQWFPVLKEGATETEDEIPDIIMLTSDIALLYDEEYLALVELFASDLSYLDTAFAAAWYKLTSRDMGQFQRCVGTDVAPPQDFQLPLPEAPADLPDTDGAKSAIMSILSSDPSYPALFVTLAWQCASTYRSTDFLGGCNGARIRFSPERDWAGNQGLDQ
ncbi:Catalase decomposes hydrogen peroxide to molecular oxygen and water [Ectocarpus siliculosus]|nr:Catalase decomposes hydrogen peroxide to molecular oxygen and water [Ectocarpus siliculosus]|eukprot:CBJ33789.1 Catalase decomposes hydrogen peroxide to molecular oxygen and water [Ectocarpus siliculosus]